ncbi:S8 family peptidase [Haloarchaeobius amylolyticus]|uniref:S8 family peptidase n=1 Tax=Haloarchaeobius amylolyticus TaxID=1198296 RepID=UPI00226EB979|nr:S8 family serine peptidase [Haloarchaeobius amylolyticus]
MTRYNRREFLTVSGAVLGGIAAGGTVTARESATRYLVDLKPNARLGTVNVVHDLSQVGLAVVEGRERDVRRLGTYAPDIELELAKPAAEYVGPAAVAGYDDPLYGLQWDKQAMGMSDVHAMCTGTKARVTIIDSGIDATHKDLEVNTTLSKNFTDDDYGAGNPAGGYHGTHVAGIAAATANNSEGVVGVAPEAELVDCRVFSPEALASFADILAAIAHATEIESDVANLSLGAYPVPRQALGQFYGKALNRVMTWANSMGTLLVISAGNDAANLQHDKNLISLPNEGAQALSVAATGPIGFGWGDEGMEAPAHSPSFYTNYGTNAITLAAPGGDADLSAIGTGVPWHLDLVLSTVSEPVFDDDGNYLNSSTGYGWAAGTSMAAPQVAGAVALLKSAEPTLNANQVESILKRSASVPDGYDKTYYGAGFLNPYAALESL